MIVINFKNYKTGKEALELARTIEKYLPKAIVAVPAVDIEKIAQKTKLTVFAQHVDNTASPKRSTGFVTPNIIKKAGAKGSLLNHSEHQLSESLIKKTISELDEAKLKTILCVPTLKIAEKLKKLNPWAMAFEDIELIATNKSITQYRTNEIKRFVETLKDTMIIPLCGAGIHSAEDVAAAKKLGCKGVLIASAIAAVPLKKAEKLLKEISQI